MDNPYSKLEEASRVYLNPTIELIKMNIDLSTVCYRIINKYPSHDSIIWSIIAKRGWTDLDLDLDVDTILLQNLKIARSQNDEHYLDYVQCHQPLKKMTLNIRFKNGIITDELATKLNINISGLTPIMLKKLMNTYIFNNKLQQGHNIIIDATLKELLKYNEGEIGIGITEGTKEGKNEEGKEVVVERVHFFELHRRYNLKYITK